METPFLLTTVYQWGHQPARPLLCVTHKIQEVKCVFSFLHSRRSESLCQTTKWWERRQRVRGETWSEHSHASWPRPEKLRASSKMTSLPSHVSDPTKQTCISVVICCLRIRVCFLSACMRGCLLCHWKHVVFTSVLIPVTVLSVIAARPSTIPYLSALLPSELELQTLEETDSSEQDDQTDSENTAGNIITVSLCYWNLPNVW